MQVGTRILFSIQIYYRRQISNRYPKSDAGLLGNSNKSHQYLDTHHNVVACLRVILFRIIPLLNATEDRASCHSSNAVVEPLPWFMMIVDKGERTIFPNRGQWDSLTVD